MLNKDLTEEHAVGHHADNRGHRNTEVPDGRNAAHLVGVGADPGEPHTDRLSGWSWPDTARAAWIGQPVRRAVQNSEQNVARIQMSQSTGERTTHQTPCVVPGPNGVAAPEDDP